MFGGAELGGAEAGGGDVASSSSSMILAVTVAADEENSESSSDGVFRITTLLGGVVSNLNRSVKPSSSSSASVHIIDSPFHVRRQVSWVTKAFLVARFRIRFIHQEAFHLSLQPVMMPILLLMKGHKKLSVVENTSALLGS